VRRSVTVCSSSNFDRFKGLAFLFVLENDQLSLYSLAIMAKRAEHLPAMPPQDPSLQVPSGLRVAYAKHLLDKHLRSLRYELNDDVSRNEPLPAIGHAPSHGHEDPLEHLSEYKGRVAIVGAGATGLYLAMMLKYLKISNVDIYEASDRIGGRVYTYKFEKDEACPHNYYDIGAMRIPEIDAMKSLVR
jgi:hypothetical protein